MPSAETFEEWIGRERDAVDRVDLQRARALAATLDRDPEELALGDALPRGWHWIYFHEIVPRSALAEDGHERRGDFLPPVPLPRRMWAGGRIRFLEDVPMGEEVRRTSTIRSVDLKDGRSGRLAFVTVEHRIRASDGTLLVDEEQDIVYLERSPGPWTPPPSPGRPDAVDPGEARRVATFTADEVTLFRFSALTFNGHRIHYDRDFAGRVEGYPDLVVHGPLLALLLLGAGERGIREEDAAAERPVRFTYRAIQPVFCGETVELWEAASAPGSVDGTRALWAEHAARGVVTRAELRAG